MIRREVLLAGAVAGLAAAAVPMLARALVLNGFDLSGALVPPAAIEAGGPPRDGIPAFWYAWVAFHPGTDLPKEPRVAILESDITVIGASPAGVWPRAAAAFEALPRRVGRSSTRMPHSGGLGRHFQFAVTNRLVVANGESTPIG